jgi:amino acid transporter
MDPNSSPPPANNRSTKRALPQVLVATTAMLTFISFWRASAVVLNDLGSSAYYAAGTAEAFIGRTAPWFVLAVMVFSYSVTAIYIESCSMFVRGGVYRVVKEAMGGTLAKVSVSALLFDFVLTGPISAVSAGLYFAALANELFNYFHVAAAFDVNRTAVFFGLLVTVYFWWQNIKGIPESSEKALRIMQLATVMIVALLGWCGYTLWVRGIHWPPAPVPHNMKLGKEALGWLYGVHFTGRFFALVAIFVGIGHSVLAMSGMETMAQVYREIEHPKLPNLKKTGFIVFMYSLIFTGFVSVLAAMIIPDAVRRHYLDNLLGGLAMSLQGPYVMRLGFHVFVVIVGVLILSGAVNTAIVGSNGVLNRISEDGVLTDWFRIPHRRYGTSYRIITGIAALQIVVILISRGNLTFLGDLYAFGVIWSFTLKGVAMLVLRYTYRGERGFRVPVNFRLGRFEIPVGLGVITLILLAIAVTNLFTKPSATVSGVVFTAFLFGVFTFSEHQMRRRMGKTRVELDQFNLQEEGELTMQSVGAHPGNFLVLVSNYYRLHHLAAVLDRVKPGRRDVIALHIRLLRRSGSGEHELAPDQLFTTIEQFLFTRALEVAEKKGKTIHLALVAANDIYDAMLRAARNLQSSSVILADSSKMPVAEQARVVGLAWERLPDPKPPLRLEIYSPSGEEYISYLGPHSPRLTTKEIDLLHNLWLRFSEEIAPEEVHHHDIVHFALDELRRETDELGDRPVVERLRRHLEEIKARRAARHGGDSGSNETPP